MSLRGLVLFEKRDLENTSQLGSFHKATPFDGENNNGQQSGLAEESRTETEARQLRSAATKGSRHECPRRLGAPAPSFEGKQIPLQNIALSHLRALRGGGPTRLQAASAPSRDPRTGGR